MREVLFERKLNQLRLVSMQHTARCSEKTFLSVENEFSHIAVDAPKVMARVKAVSTVGIA